jgi:SNF2 family DNA or RNA helicase
MARIVLGGKNNNELTFKGNKQFLSAPVRRVVDAYFTRWGGIKDIAAYPDLLRDLGDARAERFFPDTDWESLSKFYEAEMLRYTLIFHGRKAHGGGVQFICAGAQDSPARTLQTVLKSYTDAQGVLRESCDIWRLEKLLRRSGAQVKFHASFTAAMREFGASAISMEESLSFYKQVQAYHAPQFLSAPLAAILAQYMDAVHTLADPTRLPALAQELRQAGAALRILPSVEPVVAHYARLAEAMRPAAPDATPPAGSVEAVLRDTLRTKLYPFQREGVAFLTVNERALLADDMGLGKTIQAIAGALYLKAHAGLKRALIVCPASLKYQWQNEVHRFSGERCEVIGGDRNERSAVYRAAAMEGGFIALEDRPFFYVVNYELVYRDLEALKVIDPGLLILDEAQRVKNFRAKTTKAVFDIHTPYLFVLTGTPLENQLMELYTIMRFIDERALGRNPVAFRDRYVITDRFGSTIGYQRVEEVTRKIAALTLRRTKEQALDQLPELVQSEVWLDLTDTQRQIYKELRGQARELLSDTTWDSVHSNNALTLLQRLREVCDSPELIDPQYKDSQKLAELQALLEDQVGALDRQVLIFTQWTRMGEILLRDMQAAGYCPGFLHGGVPAPKRQELVQRFQNGQDRILISTDAGGTGLNLQAASLVVNYDLPFNPAKLAQRIARAHRIGQKQTVFALNLLCRSTVEEKLLRIIKEKQELFDDVFGDISDPAQARPAVSYQRSLRELLAVLLE